MAGVATNPFQYTSNGNFGNAVADPFNLTGWNNWQDPDPYGGMAQYPTYVGMDTSQFMGPNQPMNQFVNESQRAGPSAGTNLALQANRTGANAARDQAMRSAQGGAADARAQLSMKGGLGAGANAMIGKQATSSALDLSNSADANASGNRNNLLIADEAARTGNLGAASNMIQQKNLQNYNMQNDQNSKINAFNMGAYNTQMAAWGAGKQAQATQHSGKK